MEKIIKWTCFFTSGFGGGGICICHVHQHVIAGYVFSEVGRRCARGRNAVFVQHTFRPA